MIYSKQDILDSFNQYEQGHSIVFDPIHHTYTIDRDLYSGVSSIIEERNKPFLVPWAAKEAVKYLGYEDPVRAQQILSLSVDGFLSELEKAKKRHIEIGNIAKKAGTNSHDWIESHIKGIDKPIPNGDDEISIATSNAINAFLEWEHEHNPEWIVSEKVVFSLKYKFAGTLDALAIIDGQICIVDFKTSNQISDSYALQIAGYMICLEEAGIMVDKRIILRIPKDAHKAEHCVVATDEMFDKDTFLHFRECRKWNTYIKNNFTYKENGYNVVKLDRNKQLTK